MYPDADGSAAYISQRPERAKLRFLPLRYEIDALRPRDDVHVILHRLHLLDRARAMLTGLGVHVHVSESNARTVRLMRDPSAAQIVVAFDVAATGGGGAADRLVSAAREIAASSAPRRIALVPAATRVSGSVATRAERLGFESAFLWPEGGFAEVLRLLEVSASMTFRRAAPRANVPRGLRTFEIGDGIRAELLNISASGALVETDAASGDLEALGFELQVGAESRLIVARVVTRTARGDRLRLGVQFTNVDGRIREAIDRFVQSVNVLRARAPHPALDARPQRRRVRVRHGDRSDWFELLGDVNSGGRLVPKRSFFVPYQVGDEVVVEADGGRGTARQAVKMLLVGSNELDAGIDSRIAWDIAPATPPPIDPSLFGDTDPSLHIPAVRVGRNDDEEGSGLVVRGMGAKLTIQEVAAAAKAGNLATLLPHDVAYVLVSRADARRPDEARRMHTRTLFVRRRDGQLTLDLQPDMWVTGVTASHPATLGRSRSCDLHFPLPSVSKRHAVLTIENGTLFVEDLGSSNGTSIVRLGVRDGQAPANVTVAPADRVDLVDGDVLVIGHYSLSVWERARFERDVVSFSR